jgi:hypothetical protein
MVILFDRQNRKVVEHGVLARLSELNADPLISHPDDLALPFYLVGFDQ